MKRVFVIVYQFWLKKGQSTSSYTREVKKTVKDYLCRGRHRVTCIVDYSKAFDKVNYWKLFCQMTDDDNFDNDMCLVNLLAFWYSNKLLL